MKSFEVPIIYRSPLISAIKNKRKTADRMKKDFNPTILDFGPLRFYLARHFGFCYGVENAIEIAFRTLEKSPGRRVFLLSEMIHNPQVNADLNSHGVQFLQDTSGKSLIPFEALHPEDIVLIPAFGTTLEIEGKLKDLGVTTEAYNTTCPFVEKVWNRSALLGAETYTVIIHGKPNHEETRATFSRAAANAPSIVIQDLQQAQALANYITGATDVALFFDEFKDRFSPGFDPVSDLQRIGVVNQTTMLASDTQAIADFLKQTMVTYFGLDNANVHTRFADTRDTLCYATNDNQTAVQHLLRVEADFAVVVGGYNSSNTAHLAELCEQRLPTYFINGEEKIISSREMLHFDLHRKSEKISFDYLPATRPVNILLTSGASCPDALVEGVIKKLYHYFRDAREYNEVVAEFQ